MDLSKKNCKLVCKLLFSIKHCIRRFLAVVVSKQLCLLCLEVTQGDILCNSCFKRVLPPVMAVKQSENFLRCKKCGKLLISEIEICTSCRDKPVIEMVNSVFPVYPYRFWTKDLLFLWKIQNHRELSFYFAEILYSVWRERFNGIPLVPVPPRPGKIRKKGWDQISELSNILEYLYGVPVIRVLKRIEKRQQKKLTLEERIEQKQSFCLKKTCNSILEKYQNPHTLILLDDVMTTGATLQRCARELKKAKIKTVYALTLFIVE